MKIAYLLVLCLLTQPLFSQQDKSPNIFIITTDGFRWQEIFNGADSSLINEEQYTPDTSTLKALYWAATPAERRKQLMPFFWNVLNKKGQLYGNRNEHNKVK